MRVVNLKIAILQLAEADEFSKDDFAVVYQPFDLDLNLLDPSGNTDYSLLSTDCFHFSQKGHGMGKLKIYYFLIFQIKF